MKSSLTISQQGLWYISQVGQDVSAAYNVVFAFETSSALSSRALGESLNFLMLRHPVLSARVCLDDGVPQFQFVNLAAEAGGEELVSSAIGELAEVALRESGVAFNFEAGPLFRAVLVDDPQKSRCGLVLAFAHLVFDGASLPIFLRDLSHTYGAVRDGNRPVFLGHPISQEELCRREREFVVGEEGRSLIERIAARIRDVPESVSLPTRTVRGTRCATPVAGAIDLEIPICTLGSIRTFCASYRLTAAAFHLAAFEVLLWRYSQQNDFGVSFPINARDSSESALAIGYLSNLGVVRAKLTPRASVLETIRATVDSIFDALEERSVPFASVVRELKQVGRELQGPLMQIGFNFQQVGDQQNGQLGDVSLKLVSSPSMYAKNEFKLDVADAGCNVTCRFTFNKGTFERSVVQRMVSQYSALLTAFLANPHSRVQDLPLLTEAERHQILVEWNDTKADFPQDKCIHQLFEEQVERTPDAVAVVFEDQQLTYAQLNAKANQLAHHLRSLGVKPDTLVAICVERSLEMVIGLLGILKAGGAYVPLDPDYPKERLAFMLQDTSASVLLTQAHLSERVPRAASLIVCLDSEWVKIGNLADGNPPTVTSPLNLAYCIYTSGSTGRPKGALNTHRGFVNLSIWYSSHLAGHRAGERTLLASSLSFDLTQKNIIGTLIAGGLLILPNGQAVDIEALARAAVRHRPTRLNCSPSAFQAFEDAVLNGSLRTVVLGGEPVDPTLVADCNDKGLTLINSYGPTECADVAVSHLCEHGAQIDKCPLGRPLPNVQVYLLDAQLQPVPVGLKGELHIAGVGVGRGYLNRPDLTAEKFIPDPFGDPGSRMYKTGDLARYLPDGNIEFLGRIDHQVKIRGFRIELGEVEAALHRCDAVRKAVVLAREDQPGHKQLVAYVVPVSVAPAITDLRTQLSAFLPEYMVPSAWVFLDALPLNPNGKIDRKALPAPEVSRTPHEGSFIAPQTMTERLLTRIWSEVLRTESIGIDDNFFVLGGHSLLAAQVIARLRQAGFANVSLRVLFNAPTVRRLAVAVDVLTPKSAHSHLISRLPRSV